MIKKAGENIITRISFGVGILLVPVALIATMDIFGAVAKSGMPATIGQWLGLATIISVLGGTVAGLTASTRYSKRRQIIHFLITANAVVWLTPVLIIGSATTIILNPFIPF